MALKLAKHFGAEVYATGGGDKQLALIEELGATGINYKTESVEDYSRSPVPDIHRYLERVQLAEDLGLSAVWLRDVPFNVPSSGDAGQTYDPFVYLGLLAGQTKRIALGVSSTVLPLRHPAHVAKAAASIDVLSGRRILLGVASGDRPDEYPALGLPFADLSNMKEVDIFAKSVVEGHDHRDVLINNAGSRPIL